jgi:DNA-binding HxlR family transcriptional regulator
MLSRRLNKVVDAGLLERRQSSERPQPFASILTERGHDFGPVLWMLLAWRNRHFAPDGPGLVIVDTGGATRPTRFSLSE